MKHSERIAITRIISDFIRADNIIDAGEMKYYAQLKEEYGITKDIEQRAMTITLADAVGLMAVFDENRKDILSRNIINTT